MTGTSNCCLSERALKMIDPKNLKDTLEALLRAKKIVVDQADQVLRALRVFDAGKADFADCLIERTTSGAGCSETMTFDARAAKHAGMKLIH